MKEYLKRDTDWIEIEPKCVAVEKARRKKHTMIETAMAYVDGDYRMVYRMHETRNTRPHWNLYAG